MAVIRFTEEHHDIREMVSSFAQNELAPRAEHTDETAQFPVRRARRGWKAHGAEVAPGLFVARPQRRLRRGRDFGSVQAKKGRRQVRGRGVHATYSEEYS